jgi:hypothetical protein
MDPIALLSLIFTAIGTVAAVAQLDPTIVSKLKIRGFGKKSDPSSLASVSNVISEIVRRRQPQNYEVRNIRSNQELTELWKLDEESYGQANIDYEVFMRWWEAYPKGLYAIFLDDQVAGAIGIWPVTKSFIQNFSTGKLKETDLPPEAIKLAGERGTDSWYVSGLVVRSGLRRRSVVAALLQEACLSWAIDSNLRHPVNVFAISISEEGDKLLSRYEFSLAASKEKMSDGYSLYSRKVSRLDIKKLIQMHDDKRKII